MLLGNPMPHLLPCLEITGHLPSGRYEPGRVSGVGQVKEVLCLDLRCHTFELASESLIKSRLLGLTHKGSD